MVGERATLRRTRARRRVRTVVFLAVNAGGVKDIIRKSRVPRDCYHIPRNRNVSFVMFLVTTCVAHAAIPGTALVKSTRQGAQPGLSPLISQKHE